MSTDTNTPSFVITYGMHKEWSLLRDYVIRLRSASRGMGMDPDGTLQMLGEIDADDNPVTKRRLMRIDDKLYHVELSLDEPLDTDGNLVLHVWPDAQLNEDREDQAQLPPAYVFHVNHSSVSVETEG